MHSPIGKSTKTFNKPYSSQLYRLISRDQFIFILNKAFKEFGAAEFIASDAVIWIQEEYGIEMTARSIAKHLLAEGFRPIRRVSNRTVCVLREIKLS